MKRKDTVVISPVAIAQEVSVLNGLKNMLAINPDPKLKNLTRPASNRLQETLSIELLGKIQNDKAFRMRINELCRSGNVVDQNMFGQILNEGLDEIEKKGWMTHEEAATVCRQLMGESA